MNPQVVLYLCTFSLKISIVHLLVELVFTSFKNQIFILFYKIQILSNSFLFLYMLIFAVKLLWKN